MSLQEYLGGQYNHDLEDIGTIEEVLAEVGATFTASFDDQKGCWPYALKVGDSTRSGDPSQGTSAMILAAIGKMSGRCTLRDGSPTEKLRGLPSNLPDVLVVSAALAKQLKKRRKVRSGTFGDNEPLTTSHVTELARGLRGESVGRTIKAAINSTPAPRKINNLISKNPADIKAFGKALGPRWCAKSAFVALRVMRAYVDLKPILTRAVSYKEFFLVQGVLRVSTARATLIQLDSG